MSDHETYLATIARACDTVLAPSSAPAPTPPPPPVPTDFPERLERIAARHRALRTEPDTWLAARLEEWAATARHLRATTHEEFEDRVRLAERERDERIYYRGYEAGTGERRPQ